jgi:hypothetical protein
MEMGKGQGFAILIIGLLMLTGAILVYVSLPDWGNYIASYPTAIAASIPAEAQEEMASVSGMLQLVSPLLSHVGGYIQKIGYFIGSLLALISLAISVIGLRIIRSA